MTAYCHKIDKYEYRLDNIIGKGYSSIVYKGKNTQTQQQIAIKLINHKQDRNQINSILINNQIKILNQLQSLPHILSIYDIFITQNSTYIITQLCESDLSKIIKKGISQYEACLIMSQIKKGYLNLANQQIIHRDLKPANIFINSKNIIKIADFGFAIKINQSKRYNKYKIGSPLYMPPQSLKHNQYTLKSDIWALGVIFYQLLTGQTPWKAHNEKDLLLKIELLDIQSMINSLKISNKSRQFLHKCLKVDRSLRADPNYLSTYSFLYDQNHSVNRILTQTKINLINNRERISSHRNHQRSKQSLNKQNENRSSLKNNKMREGSRLKSINMRNNQKVQIKLKQYDNLSIKKRVSKSIQKSKQKLNYKIIVLQQQCNIGIKILTSQIHFCRFLFKIIIKLNQLQSNNILYNQLIDIQNLKYNYIGIIKHKIQNILSFKNYNYINIAHYHQLKNSYQYHKIISVAQSYRNKYSKQMYQYWNPSTCSFNNKSTIQIIHLLQIFLQNHHHDQLFTQTYQKEIQLLDCLLTANLLIKFWKNGQKYERFTKRSHIEEILQGKNKNISWDTYIKIIQSSKQITLNKLYQQIISY